MIFTPSTIRTLQSIPLFLFGSFTPTNHLASFLPYRDAPLGSSNAAAAAGAATSAAVPSADDIDDGGDGMKVDSDTATSNGVATS
jgi:hypothetical protein